VIRSAAAFGVAQVVLLREAAHPFHPRSSRAAGPALFQVPLRFGPSIQDLATRQAPLLALATDGPELGEAAWPVRFGLVPGVEGPGLPAHLRQGPRLRIAMEPGVESLNAATATAIALYAWRQGRPADPPRSGPDEGTPTADEAAGEGTNRGQDEADRSASFPPFSASVPREPDAAAPGG
jgi:tRNA G18 (ribose-2'-O)-methylase SpoU